MINKETMKKLGRRFSIALAASLIISGVPLDIPAFASEMETEAVEAVLQEAEVAEIVAETDAEMPDEAKTESEPEAESEPEQEPETSESETSEPVKAEQAEEAVTEAAAEAQPAEPAETEEENVTEDTDGKIQDISGILTGLLPNLGIMTLDETEDTPTYSTDYPNTWKNTKNQAVDIVQVALTQVGYAETPKNYTKYAAWFYGKTTSVAWCGIFISWCANQAGIPTTIIKKNGIASGYSVDNMASNSFKTANAYAYGTAAPKPGDIIYVDNNQDDASNHVGLIVEVDDTYIYTVEGNYTDAVAMVKYDLETGRRIKSRDTLSTDRIVFLARPAYTGGSIEVSPVVAPDEERSEGTYSVNVSTSLNVRSGPGTGYEKLGVLRNGDEVVVYEFKDSWARIEYNGKNDGWVSAKYLQAIHIHTWDEGEVRTEATENATGLILHTCTSCKSEYYEITPMKTGNTTDKPTDPNETEVPEDEDTTPEITPIVPVTETYPEKTLGTYKVNVSTTLSVRSGAGTDYAKLGYLTNGNVVTVYEITNGWARIEYKGDSTAWASAKYLTLVHAHTWNEGEVKKEATTSTTGVILYTCTSCDVQYGDTIPVKTEPDPVPVEPEPEIPDDPEPDQPATDSYAEKSIGTYKVNVSSSLSVRTGPGTDYDRIGTLVNNNVVTVYEITNGWARIDYNGNSSAWVSASYLTSVHKHEWKDDQVLIEATTTSTGVMLCTCSSCNAVCKDEIPKETVTYTITYAAGSGTGTMTDTVCGANETVTLKANSFENDGYHFAYWSAYRKSDSTYYTAAGWKTEAQIAENGYPLYQFRNQEAVRGLSAVHKDVVTFTANWEGNTFTVRYEANGGSGTMEDTTVVYGTSTTLRANGFIKTGYHFVGWTAYRASDKTYYTSKGWETAEQMSASGASLYVYKDQQAIAKTTEVEGDVITMTAEWANNTYTVKFNANGGSGSMSSITVTYGVNTALSANKFTRSGYTFSGWTAYRASDKKWFTKEAGWQTASAISTNGYTKYVYANKQAIARTTTVNGDTVTMYAVWKKK